MNQRTVRIVRAMWGVFVTRNAIQRHERLFKEFSDLGGVYIKFLQLLALNVDFMEGWSGPYERGVFEQVTYEPIDIEVEIDAVRDEFAQVESVPFAAGSFAQVYRAQLCSGDDVVIKVLRPSVRAHLVHDMRLLGMFTALLSWVRPLTIIDMRAAFEEFKRTVYREVDYTKEIAQAQWFSSYFMTNDMIIIPTTYDTLSGDTYIVQQYVGGISLAEVLQYQLQGYDVEALVRQTTGSDIWQQLTVLGTEFLKSILVAEYSIADPHPGNIKLLPDGRVGLIDFGLITPAPANREAVFELVREYQKLYEDRFAPGSFAMAMLAFYDQRLLTAFHKVSYQRGLDRSLRDVIGRYVEYFFEEPINYQRVASDIRERRMTKLFYTVINEGNRLGVSIDAEGFMLQKAMHTYIGMVANIGRADERKKHFDVMRSVLAATITHVELHGMARSQAPRMSDSEAYEIIDSWFSHVSHRDALLGKRIGVMLQL